MLGVDASINKQTGNDMKIIMIEIEDEDYETFSDSLFLLINLMKAHVSKEANKNDTDSTEEI